MKTLSTRILAIRSLMAYFLISAPLMALDVGNAAPCVELDGVSAQGSPVSGCIREPVNVNHKFTVIDFFSTLCGTCQKNVPAVGQLASDISKLATLRYVSIDRNVGTVKQFIKNHAEHMKIPVAFDVNQRAMKAYEVLATPTLFVLEKQENDYVVVYKHMGLLTAKELAEIYKLVSEQ